MTQLPSTDEVLSELREFQRSTARHAFRRLYDEQHPSLRFLVADEVGLGKTLVARGVIAQVVEHLRSIGDRRVDIVYICSNGAIARQNLRKLNIAGDEAITQADRFTLLANEIARLEQRPINIIAVTPGTSLEFGQSAGTFSERALLYAVLQETWGDAMRGAGPERVFYLGITDDKSARGRLRDKAREASPSPSVVRAFRRQLAKANEDRQRDGRPTFKVEFNRLAKAFTIKRGYTQKDREQRNRFIVELRRELATVGIEALQPDLVILDEFQRFRTLLDPSNPSWAARLAHELFDYKEPKTERPTRTLLLSATPYRPYTTADDASDDDHFEDFVHTARFLLRDEAATEGLRYDLVSLRRALMIIDRDGGVAAEAACARITERLQPVMARTERLASTPDRSGMLGRVTVPMSLERADVEGYVTIAATAELLGHRDIIEFWKSGPYLLNFMEKYALKRALDEAADSGGPAPQGLADLVSTGRGLLDWKDVERYEQIDPANARLRALIGDTVGRGIWKLLWLPPALPYYEAGGIFEDPKARSYTKRLVFSAWHLVPKVISAVVSYEAERAMFDATGELAAQPYDDFGKRSDRLLDFRTQGNRPEAMANLLTVVPFVELARLTDPLELSTTARDQGGVPTRTDMERLARERVADAVGDLVADAPSTGPVDQKWYWAAPLLLDLVADGESSRTWWKFVHASTWTKEEGEEGGRFELHLDAVWDFILENDRASLGRVPEDLVEVLVAFGLGSPAASALRAVHRVAGSTLSWDEDLLGSAARIAWGFRSLFNGPDATAVVRSTTGLEVHWRAVLEYGAMGNLQAVLDEYLHVLKEWRGFLKPKNQGFAADLAETAYSALTLRTVSYAADIPSAKNGRIVVDRHTMRGRFAIRFGDQSIEGEQRQQRAEQASHAFNSPFWPFVLSTTSIGQEGLDFHLYSHAVVHWNLPSNPVDFEQREGRVHRYKGHAIRKNVASACGGTAFEGAAGDPWVRMFEEAAAASDGTDGELSPYWVFSPEGSPAKIERHVPVLPLSRDASKLDRLLKGVATYRLSFGQPRQEELVEYLAGRLPPGQLAEIVDRLRVDLSPPS